MRVGVIQSCYLPWRGYFDFIASVDLFVVYDDVQYAKDRRTWRNRNRVKTARGLRWLKVPVDAKGFPPIDRVSIASSTPSWQESHRRLLTESLEPAPYFQEALSLWLDGCNDATGLLSPLNWRLMRAINEYLGIRTPIVNVREFELTGSRTARLIDLVRKTRASCYLSGPAARGYLDENLFRQNAIRLEYKSYDYLPYQQLWGDFIGSVTVLDLIANLGPRSAEFLRSQTPNLVAVP